MTGDTRVHAAHTDTRTTSPPECMLMHNGARSAGCSGRKRERERERERLRRGGGGGRERESPRLGTCRTKNIALCPLSRPRRVLLLLSSSRMTRKRGASNRGGGGTSRTSGFDPIARSSYVLCEIMAITVSLSGLYTLLWKLDLPLYFLLSSTSVDTSR